MRVRDYIGRSVVLRRPIQTADGKRFSTGTRVEVVSAWRGQLLLQAADGRQVAGIAIKDVRLAGGEDRCQLCDHVGRDVALVQELIGWGRGFSGHRLPERLCRACRRQYGHWRYVRTNHASR